MHLRLDHATLDPRVRHYVLPTRIVWKSGGDNAFENLERVCQDGAKSAMMRYTDAPASIVLDFGREIHGGVHLRHGWTNNQTPVRIRLRFGESVSEVMGAPNQDHSIHDLECRIPWCGAAEIGNTGFRFVRIDLLDKGTEWEIERIRGIFVFRDLPYRGSFRCNDERLNTIWQTGAYTVHLCMQDHLWDGIKRDRLVWIGDMHPETMVINTVFGETDIVPESLDKVRDETPLPRWMNGISSYSLWWVLIHHCWHHFHGNTDYLAQQRPYLLDLLTMLRSKVDADGKETLDGARFLDWPSSPDQSAVHAGLQALLTMSLRAGAELCSVLGERSHQEECLVAAKRLSRYLPPPTPSKQANALLVLSGHADAAETNAKVLGADPARNLSTFYGYYVLQARAMAGDHQGCLDVIRKFWGAMLDLGATTFWEDFNLDWTENAAGIDEPVPEGMKDIHGDFGDYCYKGLRHSLCHGWAAGPTAWMSQHVLGVRPVAPGFAKVAIEPHLGDLAFAEGTYPTPKGDIRVRHERQADGAVASEIDLPEGIVRADG